MIKFPITDTEIDPILSFICFVVGGGGGDGFGFCFVLFCFSLVLALVYLDVSPLNAEERIQIMYKSGKIHVDMKSKSTFECSEETRFGEVK